MRRHHRYHHYHRYHRFNDHTHHHHRYYDHDHHLIFIKTMIIPINDSINDSIIVIMIMTLFIVASAFVNLKPLMVAQLLCWISNASSS